MYSSSKNFTEKPINLLSFDTLGHALINESALDFIRAVPRPISIMSIAGPYRTGKSFLLNSIIGSASSFQVSSTTTSCTKGLWIWGRPLTAVDEQGKITNVLVIDTEGFGSCEEYHDRRIIILALLLSTCFIYNSKGMIDRDSLRDLQYVIEETKKVKREISFDSVTDFHWVLRDFHLQLVNELGLEISADQYMEKCFKDFSEQGEQERETFRMLSQFFRNRACHTLVAPQTDPSQQQNPQFMQQLLKFKKIINGIPSMNLDGLMLSQVIKAYVSAMNDNLSGRSASEEGTQCKLRLNCLSQLCKELEAISCEDAQKKSKLLKNILTQVEDAFISKMTSEKQIKILKDEINVLVTEFSISNNQSMKNSKAREHRVSLSLPKQPRQSRVSLISVNEDLQQYEKQKSMRTLSKIEMATAQKIRQQLQAKIHRFELIIAESQREVRETKQQCDRIQRERERIEDEYNTLSEDYLQKQKRLKQQIDQLGETLEQVRKQKMIRCSELQRTNQLLQEKIKFLEETIANMEISGSESVSALVLRYKEQIAYLEKENLQLLVKHQKQIDQLKLIYAREEQSEQVHKSNKAIMRNKQLGEEIKAHMDQISRLQEENAGLLIVKTQVQNRNMELEELYAQLQQSTTAELEKLARKLAEKERELNDYYLNLLETKERMLKEVQARLQESQKLRKQQLENFVKKLQQQNQQTAENMSQLENQLNRFQQECVQLYQKLELSEDLCQQKQKVIESLKEQMQGYRSKQSQSYHKNFESSQALMQQLQKQREQVENQRLENNQLRQALQKAKKQAEHQIEGLKMGYQQKHHASEMQIMNLQQKIITLSNTQNTLKEISKQYEQFKNKAESFEKQIVDLTLSNESKNRSMQRNQAQITGLRKENQRLEKVINDLSNSIQSIQQQMRQHSEKTNQKNELKQAKYLEVLTKLHEKQKQCYQLSEAKFVAQKQREKQQKEFRKQLKDEIQQKTQKIKALTKQNQNLKSQEQQQKIKMNQLRHQLEVTRQNFTFTQQNASKKFEYTIQQKRAQLQKLQLKCNQLEKQVKRLLEQKISLQKRIRMYQNDCRQTCQSIQSMQAKHNKSCQQYEASLKMLRRRIYELQQAYKQLSSRYQKCKLELEYLAVSKKLIEQNYNEDFKVWCSKVQTYQQQKAQLKN